MVPGPLRPRLFPCVPYIRLMLGRLKAKPSRLLPAKFIQPCLGANSDKVPTGQGWIHEIKHDGYRMQVRKDADRVRLFTRRGFDWTDRYPRIVAAALTIKAGSFTIDRETVCAGADGVADFARLHSRCFDGEAFLYAFDLMELEGMDLKARPLAEREALLKNMFQNRTGKAWHNLNRIYFVEHDKGGGAALFEAACRM